MQKRVRTDHLEGLLQQVRGPRKIARCEQVDGVASSQVDVPGAGIGHRRLCEGGILRTGHVELEGRHEIPEPLAGRPGPSPETSSTRRTGTAASPWSPRATPAGGLLFAPSGAHGESRSSFRLRYWVWENPMPERPSRLPRRAGPATQGGN